jgi:hypothetical protein
LLRPPEPGCNYPKPMDTGGKVNHNDPFLTIDREHELQGEQAEAFDRELAEVSKRHAKAMRTNATSGHQQTLEAIASSLGYKLAPDGVSEHLIRSALARGPLLAGQMLLDLIGKCIDEDAETAALVEIDRAERAGGLNMNAMRAAAPQEVRVPS